MSGSSRTRINQSKGGLAGAIILTLLALAMALLAIDYLYMQVPRFGPIFADFEIELPALAIWLNNAAAWTSATGQGPLDMPLWLGIAAVVIALAGVLLSFRHQVMVITLATIACILLGIVIVAMVSVMENPTLKIYESVVT